MKKEDIEAARRQQMAEFAAGAIDEFKKLYPDKPIPQFIQDMITTACGNAAMEWYLVGYDDGWMDKGKDVSHRLGLGYPSEPIAIG